MRELIYVSDAKLRQFTVRPRRLARTRALRLNTPLGGLDVESDPADAAQERLRRLREVDKHLARSAYWWEEPGLRPGQWISYEARLHCVRLKDEFCGLVLFADPPPGSDEDAGDADGAPCRLLMHGSARHLLGLVPEPIDGPPLQGIDGGSSSGSTFVTAAGHLVRAMARHEDAGPGPSSESLETHGSIRALLLAIDAQHGSVATAAWMRGYARVTAESVTTARGGHCVIASPLSVEYAHDLP